MFYLVSKFRSSLPEVFLRKGILKICSKFTREQLYWNHTSAWKFSCKSAAYFRTHSPKNTSGKLLEKIWSLYKLNINFEIEQVKIDYLCSIETRDFYSNVFEFGNMDFTRHHFIYLFIYSFYPHCVKSVYYPWKHKKNICFLIFWVGMERKH